jgi:hypothetical protein
MSARAVGAEDDRPSNEGNGWQPGLLYPWKVARSGPTWQQRGHEALDLSWLRAACHSGPVL